MLRELGQKFPFCALRCRRSSRGAMPPHSLRAHRPQPGPATGIAQGRRRSAVEKGAVPRRGLPGPSPPVLPGFSYSRGLRLGDTDPSPGPGRRHTATQPGGQQGWGAKARPPEPGVAPAPPAGAVPPPPPRLPPPQPRATGAAPCAAAASRRGGRAALAAAAERARGGRAARPGRRSERRRRGRGESGSMEHNHLHLHNGSLVPHHRYGCGLGYAPVVYYSLLLCLGLPGECRAEPRRRAAGKRLPPGCCSAPGRRERIAALPSQRRPARLAARHQVSAVTRSAVGSEAVPKNVSAPSPPVAHPAGSDGSATPGPPLGTAGGARTDGLGGGAEGTEGIGFGVRAPRGSWKDPPRGLWAQEAPPCGPRWGFSLNKGTGTV